jgi:hypothetical protein
MRVPSFRPDLDTMHAFGVLGLRILGGVISEFQTRLGIAGGGTRARHVSGREEWSRPTAQVPLPVVAS